MAAGKGHGSGGQGVKQLRNAVAKGSAERVAELLRQGTDPGTRDRRGRTPLHIAVRRSGGSGRVIRALAAAGLDLDATDREGNSALHLAALRPNLIAYTALVECGANSMLPNAKGLTPSAILERAVHPVTPSDAMYRFVFRHKPMGLGLLGLVLPPGMVGEDAEVTAIDGDLVSHTLSHQLRSDLVLVLLREGARPVTVICEFQSRTDTDMAERMAAYRIETIRTMRRHHPELLGPDGRVPFTMGVVVHTGGGTWDAATDAAELMDPTDHPGLGIHRLSSAHSVIDVLRADLPDDPDNPAAAYFRLLRGDPEFVLPAARTLDRLLPLDKYRPLRHLLTAGVALGVDAETHPEVRTILEGEPAMTPFAENFNRAVAAARDAAAEAARERAEAARERAEATRERAEAAREKARADDALARVDEAAAEAARERARADEAAAGAAKADEALARERELVLDVVALRFDPEVARRVRPVLEAMDGPDAIYGVPKPGDGKRVGGGPAPRARAFQRTFPVAAAAPGTGGGPIR